MHINMTRGKIPRTLIAFTIPLILSGLLQQLYTWADAVIIGHVVGENSLAAISVTTIISSMYTSILSGFSIGVSILISTAYGKGDLDVVSKTTSTFAIFLTAVALVASFLGLVGLRPLLHLMNTPEAIFYETVDYAAILFIGVPFMALYNIYTAALNGIGDSRTPLLSIIVSSVLNISLNYLLVAVLKQGVIGAAVATVLAQIGMTAFIALFAVNRYRSIRFKLNRDCMSRSLLFRGLKLSIPTAVQACLRSIGGIMLQNIMNSFGEVAIAGITTGYRIDSVALLPVVNVGSGVSTFTAQNVGVGNRYRVKKGLWIGMALSVAAALIIIALIVPFEKALMSIFNLSNEAVEIGCSLIRTLAPFYPVYGIMNALIGYLQGLEDVMFTSAVSIIGLALRIALSYLLRPLMGIEVIALSELICWTLMAIAYFVRYRVKFSMKPKMLRRAAHE